MANNELGFQSFSQFIESVEGATHDEHAALSSANVKDAPAFDAMKNHILGLYEGVEVQHSFVDENGQIFDCVPIEQQPSLKGTSEKPAKAPDAPHAGETDKHGGAGTSVGTQSRSDVSDRYGNAKTCAPGTIPMRRVTLQELTRSRDLREFFHKAPDGQGRHPRLGAAETNGSPPAITAGQHKYAHAFQTVKNVGGHSDLGIWAPVVGSQVFSLSQQWYAGGSPVQTVEIGLQTYPAKYNTPLPVLFIYWTADGYKNTGSYNLDRSGFVQTNPNWHLGGTVGPLSVYGGAQYLLSLSAFLTGGRWWLYAGGGAASNAIGYYPASLYGSGPLGTGALDVDFGGEVVDQTAFPPMGSAHFASEGWTRADYHRAVQYYPTTGGVTDAALTASQPSPNCYTIGVSKAAAPWSEYFFFGGPGGTACS